MLNCVGSQLHPRVGATGVGYVGRGCGGDGEFVCGSAGSGWQVVCLAQRAVDEKCRKKGQEQGRRCSPVCEKTLLMGDACGVVNGEVSVRCDIRCGGGGRGRLGCYCHCVGIHGVLEDIVVFVGSGEERMQRTAPGYVLVKSL